MQCLVSVIDDKTGSATPDEMVAIDAFNDGSPGKNARPSWHLGTLRYCTVWVSWSRLRSMGESLACPTHLEASSTPQVTLTDSCRSVRTSCCSVASTPTAT